jgi:hypothetical protein
MEPQAALARSVARDQPVSAAVSKRTVIDLRCFFNDVALWAEPSGRPSGCCSPQTSSSWIGRCLAPCHRTATGT